MRSVLIPSGIGKQGASNWAWSPSLAAMMMLKSGRLLKFLPMNFEATHLKDEERLKTLFSVLTIAFCWSYHVGAWRHMVTPIRIKKHQRPAQSIFRYGFDWIRQAVLNPNDQCDLLTQVLTLLWNALTGPKSHVYQLYPI